MHSHTTVLARWQASVVLNDAPDNYAEAQSRHGDVPSRRAGAQTWVFQPPLISSEMRYRSRLVSLKCLRNSLVLVGVSQRRPLLAFQGMFHLSVHSPPHEEGRVFSGQGTAGAVEKTSGPGASGTQRVQPASPAPMAATASPGLVLTDLASGSSLVHAALQRTQASPWEPE